MNFNWNFPVIDATQQNEVAKFLVGVSGANFTAKVKKFQSNNDLTDSGQVDWLTGHTIVSKFFDRELRHQHGQEMVGEDVEYFRALMNLWRTKNGLQAVALQTPPKPKQFDTAMADAVKLFRQKVGLPVNKTAEAAVVAYLTRHALKKHSGPKYELKVDFKVGGTAEKGYTAEVVTEANEIYLAHKRSKGVRSLYRVINEKTNNK